MHESFKGSHKRLWRNRKTQVSEKAPGDFVTASDKRVEKILINELAKTEYSF